MICVCQRERYDACVCVCVHGYLWGGPEVDNALQLHLVAKLLHQEGVPVLVDRPLCSVDAAQLKHVQGKDVPRDHKQLVFVLILFKATYRGVV